MPWKLVLGQVDGESAVLTESLQALPAKSDLRK
jgi:hypothetical protein